GKLKAGNFEEAVKEFDKALQLFPKLTAAYINRAYANIQAGHYSRARSDLAKAGELAKERKNPQTLEIIAHVNTQLEQAEKSGGR
ncbi:MAG: tetratricopeptide repeat protein, partial [Victivallales bacterium]|nr:tetratricopeptide repeat protein [Victivallales bacterium]